MADNDDFDFRQFASNAILYIDSKRSYVKGTFTQESRINAFYRILGLPAVVPVEKDSGNARKVGSIIDPANNGNVFENTASFKYDKFQEDFISRKNSFFSNITKNETKFFLDNIDYHVDYSIPNDSDAGGTGGQAGTQQASKGKKRKRGMLFPTVVDGSIFINPNSRRICDPFASEIERKKLGDVYTRPLIETIIYIKLNKDNNYDSTKQDDIITTFQVKVGLRELGNSPVELLEAALKKIGPILAETANNIGKVRKKVGIDVVPTFSNIPDQNPKVEESEKIVGELDIKKALLEYNIALKDSILSTFSFNDTLSLDNSRSLVDTGFTSVLLSALAPPQGSTEKEKESVDQEVEKATVEIKEYARTLDLIFGEFSGLSGVDILVVITALFKLEEKYLLGLLNKKSLANLKKIKGDVATPASVTESKDKLESTIRQVFKETVSSIKVTTNRIEKEQQNKKS